MVRRERPMCRSAFHAAVIAWEMRGGAGRYVAPLNNGDPACWRPAWGGVRLRGVVWLSRSPLHPVCRFAQDDTWGRRGVVRSLFGANVSAVRPPSSGASRHLPPRRGRLFRWCGALCGASQQRRSRLLAPRLGGVRLCGNGWWVRLIFGGRCRYDEVICSEMTQWVGWNVVRNLFGSKYSTVKLTDTAFCFPSRAPVPHVSS